MNIENIKALKNKEGFTNIDIELAQFVNDISKSDDPILFLSTALTSWALRNNNICLDINRFSETVFPIYESINEPANNSVSELPTILMPDAESWISTLKKFSEIVGNDGNTPIVLDNKNRLYIQKYWFYEKSLAALLKSHHNTDFTEISNFSYNELCSASTYFKNNEEDVTDNQKLAVFVSLINSLSLITGGPGTGKTTIVSVILSILLEKYPELNIKLCAPTGKAANRLKESISDEIQNMTGIKEATLNKIKKINTYTIHRLLGVNYLSPNFRHNEDKKLNLDVLIIDEASMIDLSLFYKLIKSVPQNTKIIILGDKDQLASVEAGAVLANIFDAGTPNCFTEEFIDSYKIFTSSKNLELNTPLKKSPLSNCIVELDKSYRFDDNKGIGLVKNAIQSVETKGINYVVDIATTSKENFILSFLPEKQYFGRTLLNYIKELKLIINGEEKTFIDYTKSKTVEEAYSIFSEFRILCSHNSGPFGVQNVNKIIKYLIYGTRSSKEGLPIMIRENNNQLDLFNGDVGMLWPDEKGIEKAYFPETGNSKLKSVSISLLPAHEEVFAMTVHKSQGSGFQKVLIIFPDKDSQLLTRELLYTGITRAKKQCELWANEDIFKSAVLRKTERDSGLKDALIF